MPHDIFVLGLDESNRTTLQNLPDADHYRFHQLLGVDELRAGHIDLPALLDKARAQVRAFGRPVDAIVGYWDFPVSSMVPILSAQFGLRSASLESVVTCEHKYWSRLAQRQVISEYPRFALIDLERDTTPPAGLRYPVWLKPVKSTQSMLAFRVSDDLEFANAAREIRDGMTRVGQAFDSVLEHLTLPPEIAAVGGRACLAEEAATGFQITVEGYRFDDQTHIYGVVDSVNYPNSSSFLRYQYPSRLPTRLIDRARDICHRVIPHIGLDSVTFNVEFFVDVERDTMTLLEINPRHSQSHARLFEYVDGVPNHQCMVRLALGRHPELPRGQGPYRNAAKWFVRRFADGVVRRSPSPERVARVERDIPGVAVDVVAHEGDRLSHRSAQDSYSYELAHIHVGADRQEELVSKYQQCVRALDFDITG